MADKNRNGDPEAGSGDAAEERVPPEPVAAEAEPAGDDGAAAIAAERDRYLELAQRAQADLDNYRKRSAREVAEAERRGRGTLARQLAPSLDNLERALMAAGVAPDPAALDGGDPISEEVSGMRALAEGIALVYRELRETLERAGVVVFDPLGERFDPNLHEAISTRTEDGVEPGQVVETLERGYRLEEQVLRAAKVIVSE